MAPDFENKNQYEYSLNKLNKYHFMAIAIEAAFKSEFYDITLGHNQLIAKVQSSLRSSGEIFTIHIENETAIIKSECNDGSTNDFGKNELNIERFLTEFSKVQSEILPDILERKVKEIKDTLETIPNNGIFSENLKTSKLNTFIALFKPRQGYYITPILLITNIALFILMSLTGVNIFTPDSPSLIAWGANLKMLTLDGEWWRLMTSCFLHIGVLHLLMNMYALLYIGTLLEPLIGQKRFISAYLLTGICSSLLSLCWHDQVLSAGASGAIFGMYGVFLALLSTNLIEKNARNEMAKSIGIFVVLNLAYGMKAGIDNAGHVGGLLSGIAIGFAYLSSIKQPENKSLMHKTIGIVTGVVLLITASVYANLPNNMAEYSQQMQRFADNEKATFEINNLIHKVDSREAILLLIQRQGINPWKENLKIIESLKQLNLPENIQRRNTKLTEYCKMRLHVMELVYQGIIEDEQDKYEHELTETNKKIEALLNELNKEE